MDRTVNYFEGQLEYGAGGNRVAFTANNPYAFDWVYRHEHLQKAIFNHQMIIEATNSDGAARGQYIERKTTDLNLIATNLRDLFKMELKRYLTAGYPQDQSKKLALKHTENFKKEMLEMHQKRYPDEFSHAVVMKMLTVKKQPGVESGRDVPINKKK